MRMQCEKKDWHCERLGVKGEKTVNMHFERPFAVCRLLVKSNLGVGRKYGIMGTRVPSRQNQ
jgi:hypothetical protein